MNLQVVHVAPFSETALMRLQPEAGHQAGPETEVYLSPQTFQNQTESIEIDR